MSYENQRTIAKLRCKARAVPGSQDFGFTKNNNEQVGIRVDVLDGDLSGNQYTWYGFFTPAAEARTLESLKIAGWDGGDIIEMTGLGATEFELQLDQIEDGDTGEQFWKPVFINRMGVAMGNPMNVDQREVFRQKMKGRLGAKPVANGNKPDSAQDDINF